MAKLAVNVDHVATLRQARRGIEPDPVIAAAMAELGGAEGIIVHLREDRRHIQERDLRLLRETVKTKLNLEMAATDAMIKIALDVKPDMVTLVPERREELTTEGGLEVVLNKESLKSAIELLHEGDIAVSLFINPDMDQIKASAKIGTDFVEIHTGIYSEATNHEDIERELDRIIDAIKLAHKLRLGINAGHGLNYQNIKRLTGIKEIYEFSIGHSIVARAIYVGFEKAVREMLQLIRGE
ncbi:MAG TPA: pyridoxine 5'-phosphate synthase [Syntrophaceae bacterium]|nr:pyridoxine 5'-phosphate synthase [Syntrophaceae bacterium]